MLRASLFHARTVAPQSPGVPNGRPPITRRLVSDQALFELSSCSSHVRRSPRTRPVFPSLETVKHCRRSFRQRASKGWFSSVILVVLHYNVSDTRYVFKSTIYRVYLHTRSYGSHTLTQRDERAADRSTTTTTTTTRTGRRRSRGGRPTRCERRRGRGRRERRRRRRRRRPARGRRRRAGRRWDE